MNTDLTLMLPRKDFVASIATSWNGSLHACSRLWDGYALECPVLDMTPLKDAPWATLQAYMQRRFGPAHMGGDDYKDLGGKWMLTTPDPAVFVEVCPSLSGAGFSFTPRCCDEGMAGIARGQEGLITTERIEQIKQAYTDALIDLLRPVGVRDNDINALGEVDDENLLAYDEESEEHIFKVEPHSSSGYCMPTGLFGGEDWATLCTIIGQMGDGDMQLGRKKVIEQLQMPVYMDIGNASWPIKRLVLMGSQDPDKESARLGMSSKDIEQFHVELQMLKQEKTAALIDEISDSDLSAAIKFLQRLGNFDTDLQPTVDNLRTRRQCDLAWDELVALSKDDFPRDALPKTKWPHGEDIALVLKEGFRRNERADMADWVDRTIARPSGKYALQLITHHLQSGTFTTEKGSGGA